MTRSALFRSILALTLVLGGVGAQPGSGRMTPGMMPMPMSVSVSSEFDYLSEMIPHHEEAVAAARLLLAGTRRPELRDFARRIIATQTAELQQMRRWVRAWYPTRPTPPGPPMMMRDLRGLTGDTLDRAFLQDMPRHHMAAIMLSQQLIRRNLVQHPEVQPFAMGIVRTQRDENHQMMRWLFDWYGWSMPR